MTAEIAAIEALLSHAAWEEARGAAIAALARAGGDPRLLLLLARAIEGGQGAAAALPAYAQAAAPVPLDAAVQEAFAAALDRSGRAQDAAVVRFTCFSRGGRQVASLLGLATYLFDTGQTLSGDRLYDGTFFARLAMITTEHPLHAVLPLISRYWNSAHGARAVGLVRDCAALLPGDAVIWRILGSLVYFRGEVETARAAFDAAVAAGNDAHSRIMRALLIEPVMMSAEDIAASRARVEAEIDTLLADPTLAVDLVSGRDSIVVNLFYFAYHGADDRPLMEKIGRMFAHADPHLRWTAPHLAPPRRHDRPARVGLVGSLEIDSVSRMLKFLPPVLRAQGLELHYFSEAEVAPAIRAEFPGAWHVLPAGVGPARAAIAGHELDVVMFTDLFMNWLYYFLAFSRLARVQCLWPGHPVTSGLDTIDYFLSADTLERADADADYAEALVRLPDLCTVYPRLPLHAVDLARSEFGIADDARLYLCTQVLFKLHPDFDAALRGILEADPKACIILFENPRPEHAARLNARFAQAFAGHEDRVRMLPRLPLSVFLGLNQLADVVLDTFHFGGGNTAFQALQSGVPIVTLPGRYHRGRSTSSLYKVMGIADLVAQDPDDFVRLAVRLAKDRAFRERCVADIRLRQDRLFDRQDVAEAYARLFAGWIAAPASSA